MTTTNAWDGLIPTRLAISGDWHGNSRYAVNAIEWAAGRGADIVLHVGDFGYEFTPKFLGGVQRVLEDTELTLGLVAGNHDSYTYLDKKEKTHGCTAIPLRQNIFYLPRCYRWEWSGVRFLGMGGAHSVDRPWRVPGREWWARETIRPAEAQRAIDDGPADVMITHDVPAGVRIPCIEGNPHGFPEAELYAAQCHRRVLRQIVDEVEPRHLFAGHYHTRLTDTLEGNGYSTIVNILDCDGSPIQSNTMIVELMDLI